MLKDVELIYGKNFVGHVREVMFPGKAVVDLKAFLKKLPKYLELREYLVLDALNSNGCVQGKYISKPGLYFYIPEIDKWCLLCENKADVYEHKLFMLRTGLVKAAENPEWTLDSICEKYPKLLHIYGRDLIEKVLPYIKREEVSVSLQRVIEAIYEYASTSDCPHKTRYLGKVPSFLMKDTQDLDEVVNGIVRREFFSTGLYIKVEKGWRYVFETVQEVRAYYDQLVNYSIIGV